MKVTTVKNMLVDIEHNLKQQQLWSDTFPSAEALASSTPFACDVMAFEQWLQFIFLPKMRWLVDNEQPLPTKISVAPMAEHTWQHKKALAPLIILITEMDSLLNDV